MHDETLGWLAAALMVATFSCRDARHLRPLAVATNLAFIGYGLTHGLAPVLALHLLLLPMNLWRGAQAYGLRAGQFRELAEHAGRRLCAVMLLWLPITTGG